MVVKKESGVYSTQIGRWSDLLFYWDIFKFIFLLMLRVILFLVAYATRKFSQFLDYLSEHYKVEEHLRLTKKEKQEFIEPKLTIKNKAFKIKYNSNDNSIFTNKRNNEVIASAICSARSQNINQDLDDIKKNDNSHTFFHSDLNNAQSIHVVKTGNQSNAEKKEIIDLSVVNNKIEESTKKLSHNEQIAKKIVVSNSNKKAVLTVHQNDIQHNAIILPAINVDKKNEDIFLNECAVKMNNQENIIKPENGNLASACSIESNLELTYNNYNANDIKDDKSSKTEENMVLSISCNNNDLTSKNDSESQCTAFVNPKRERSSKSRSPIHLITKTLMENLNGEHNKKVELELKTTNNLNTHINEDLIAKSPVSSEIGNTSDKYLVEKFSNNQQSHLEKSDNFKRGTTNNSWSKRCCSSSGGSPELTNGKDTFYRNVRDHKELDVEKLDSYGGGGNRRLFTKNERSIHFIDSKEEICNVPTCYALARFITADFQMTPDTTIDFQTKYGCTWGELFDQSLKPGDVGVVVNNNQYIFFLIVKNKNDHQRIEPVFIDNAVSDLANKMKQLKLTKLAVCAMSNGLQRFVWSEMKKYFNKYFFGSNISIMECFMPPKNEMKPLPVVNRTYTNLWDMEKQTDIIMFINIEEIYNEDWNDQVVEKIDAKYPFKEKLLNDINIKPMASGDVLMYKINGEVLLCIFVNSFGQHKDRYKCLEKSFNKIKSMLNGYRFFGIQQNLKVSDSESEDIWRKVFLLRSVFTKQSGEIWMCGDTNAHKLMQYEEYKKTVNDAMNDSSTSKSTSNGYNSPKFGNFRSPSRFDGKRSGELISTPRSESLSRFENRRKGGNDVSRFDSANLVRRSNSQSSMISKFNKANNKLSASNNNTIGMTLNNKNLNNSYSMSSNDYLVKKLTKQKKRANKY
ncbi:uncharacterized protein LOC126899551 isoform X2 [Daktulosphaira vitifoliae]|uniref:uncharacterized protein LOC126899551 isoform X2 n=1 Tax=Daktulosphaira vitifoliae TaxID=58002 RepID=UPI0021AA431A|nr:uncharacterized protein LOC126899551 isoform X2 [Daktulosphaira vitifoliae]